MISMINTSHIPHQPLVFFLSLLVFCLTVLISLILKHTQVFLISSAFLFVIATLVIIPLNFFGTLQNNIFNAASFILGLIMIPATLGVVFFTLVHVHRYIFSNKKYYERYILFYTGSIDIHYIFCIHHCSLFKRNFTYC